MNFSAKRGILIEELDGVDHREDNSKQMPLCVFWKVGSHVTIQVAIGEDSRLDVDTRERRHRR